MAASKPTSASEELQYASGNLRRETGWWGAFVIGLAGTILVTGIAPVMVTQLGASGIPVTVFITLSGWLLCLFLAELAAMMPERTGGKRGVVARVRRAAAEKRWRNNEWNS